MLLSALLAVVMVLSMVPMFAFAQGLKPVTDIAVETKKPVPGASYTDPDGKADKSYKINVAKKCGLKVVEESWMSVTKDGAESFIPNFWGSSTYLMSVKLKVKNGYALPEDLSKLKVSIKYDDEKPVVLDAKQYRSPDKFKMEGETYTVKYVNEPRAKDKTADIELLYAMILKPLPMPEMVITTKKPVEGDFYILPEGTNNDYHIYIMDSPGFLVDKEGWLAIEKDGLVHFDNEFTPGRKYVLAMGLTFMPRYGMYELPKDLKDVKIKLDFTNTDDVELTEKEYRAGKEFKFEVGTYTLRPVENKDYDYEFMYVVDIPEVQKPEEKPTDEPSKPAQKPTDAATTVPVDTTTVAADTQSTDEKVPDTGVSASSITVALLAVSIITAGSAVAIKKKKQ